MHMHAHATHTHTPPPPHLATMSLRTLDEIQVTARRGRLSWRIIAHHLERSMINSCQSVTPERSLDCLHYTTIVVLHLVVSSCHLAGILTPVLGCDFQASSRYAPATVGVCLSCSSTGSSSVFSRISVFHSMFQWVTPRTSLKHTHMHTHTLMLM